MRRCTGPCGLEKHPDEFGKRARAKDGLREQCKACTNAAQKARQRTESMPPKDHLEAWAPFGTPMQRATVAALLAHGSIPAAAEALQLSARALHGHLHELERAAAKRGWLPGDGPIENTPEGFSIKGTSTMYGPDGEVKLRWVKTKSDEESKLEQLLAAMPRIVEPFKGFADPVEVSPILDEDLMCVYPFGDPHLGMHAWAAEAGENFDLAIAERDLIAGVDHLVGLAPCAATAIIAPLGDTSHADGKSGTTTKGTPLDVDSRWPKVFGVIIRAMRRNIDLALTKHRDVYVKCVNGNHDDLTSLALAVCLHNFYEREPRVHVDTSPAKFFWHRFGKNLLGFTHGDTVKPADLPQIMAGDRAKDWGETLYRYWYTGHIHHETVKEFRHCTVESFRTLAPKDAYHASHGYRAGQDIRVHIWHREFGKINEHHVGIQQIRRAG